MATIKQKRTEAKKSTKKKVMPTFKDKFPVLSQMETWTGPFRRRCSPGIMGQCWQ